MGGGAAVAHQQGVTTMILGLTMSQFTALHVAISLIGIGAGLIALPAFARGRILRRTTGIFCSIADTRR